MPLFDENDVEQLATAVGEALQYFDWVRYFHFWHDDIVELINAARCNSRIAETTRRLLLDRSQEWDLWQREFRATLSSVCKIRNIRGLRGILYGHEFGLRYCSHIDNIQNLAIREQLTFGFKPINSSYVFCTHSGGRLADQSVILATYQSCQPLIGLIPLHTHLIKLNSSSSVVDFFDALESLSEFLRYYLIPFEFDPFTNELNVCRGQAWGLQGRFKYEIAKLRLVALGSSCTLPPLPAEDEWLVAKEFRHTIADELLDYAEIADRVTSAGREIEAKTLQNHYKPVFGSPDAKRGNAHLFCWGRIKPKLEAMFEMKFPATG